MIFTKIFLFLLAWKFTATSALFVSRKTSLGISACRWKTRCTLESLGFSKNPSYQQCNARDCNATCKHHTMCHQECTGVCSRLLASNAKRVVQKCGEGSACKEVSCYNAAKCFQELKTKMKSSGFGRYSSVVVLCGPGVDQCHLLAESNKFTIFMEARAMDLTIIDSYAEIYVSPRPHHLTVNCTGYKSLCKIHQQGKLSYKATCKKNCGLLKVFKVFSVAYAVPLQEELIRRKVGSSTKPLWSWFGPLTCVLISFALILLLFNNCKVRRRQPPQ